MKVNKYYVRDIMIFQHGACELTDEDIDSLYEKSYNGMDVPYYASQWILKIRSMMPEMPLPDGGTSYYTKDYLDLKKWLDEGMEGECPVPEERLPY